MLIDSITRLINGINWLITDAVASSFVELVSAYTSRKIGSYSLLLLRLALGGRSSHQQVLQRLSQHRLSAFNVPLIWAAARGKMSILFSFGFVEWWLILEAYLKFWACSCQLNLFEWPSAAFAEH